MGDVLAGRQGGLGGATLALDRIAKDPAIGNLEVRAVLADPEDPVGPAAGDGRGVVDDEGTGRVGRGVELVDPVDVLAALDHRRAHDPAAARHGRVFRVPARPFLAVKVFDLAQQIGDRLRLARGGHFGDGPHERVALLLGDHGDTGGILQAVMGFDVRVKGHDPSFWKTDDG